jgi:hypothetical protein
MNGKSKNLLRFVTFLVHLCNTLSLDVGAGSASRYGSASTKIMRHRLSNTGTSYKVHAF